ncbi:MAG: tRNA epoxyqueuosine(34) reductase QueG [Bacteroidales bacterium]|nr:tRNA epoxyqueuosine(34) reductase QueG [Bacteroidales bacterium]
MLPLSENINSKKLSELIKSYSLELGFSFCGISKAAYLDGEAIKLKSWLNNDFHAGMKYMENHFEKRLDPRLLVENAKSTITVLLNYFPDKEIPTENNYKIAKYAYGKDYHFVVKEKLKLLLEKIISQTGEISARTFVDSAPVMDKVWAEKCGLGWIGKNTCLINKNFGSFFFIGNIILDVELEYDKAKTNHCGNCTACINACPTGALSSAYKLDANKCISYLTIENKDEIPENLKTKLNDWIFGCDICQDVCPWNKKAKKHNVIEFLPSKELMNMTKEKWQNLTKEEFNKLFKNSAVKRTKYSGLKRNIEASKYLK